jgi:SAM-dependent methyltransferase
MKYKACTDYWLDKENFTLRGDFEAMYKDIDDPWGCGEYCNSLNNKVFCEMLFHKKYYTNILDIGSGLGELTSSLYEYNKGGNVSGWEISNTAVLKARKKYPMIIFKNKNILIDSIDLKYDLITMSEVLWYLLDGLKEVFEKIYNGLSDDGLLAIHQYFPNEQKFGKEYIDGIGGFESFIENNTKFEFVDKLVSYDNEDKVLLAMLKKRNI